MSKISCAVLEAANEPPAGSSIRRSPAVREQLRTPVGGGRIELHTRAQVAIAAENVAALDRGLAERDHLFLQRLGLRRKALPAGGIQDGIRALVARVSARSISLIDEFKASSAARHRSSPEPGWTGSAVPLLVRAQLEQGRDLVRRVRRCCHPLAGGHLPVGIRQPSLDPAYVREEEFGSGIEIA